MCGIWGVWGDIVNVRTDKFVKDAALVGTVRGDHGTGVFHVYHNKQGELFSNMYKAAVNGATFVASADGNNILTTSSNSLGIVGHNRWATGGGYDDAQAHPFRRGNITLVHNGVIDNVAQLRTAFGVDDDDIKVDSDMVAACLSSTKNPIEVLEAVRGAFAFVWFDEEKETLFIAKNSERPLHFLSGRGPTIFASELGMLSWLNSRHNLGATTHHELSAGSLLAIKRKGQYLAIESSTPFNAAPRTFSWSSRFLDDDYSYSTASTANRSHIGNASSYAGTGSSDSGASVNKEGRTYGEVVDLVWKHLGEKHGIMRNTPVNFSPTQYRAETPTSRAYIDMIMQEDPFLTCRKWFSVGGGTSDFSKAKLDEELEEYLATNWDMVHTITGNIVSIVLAGEAANQGWKEMSAAEIIAQRAYNVFISTETILCHEFSGPTYSDSEVKFSAKRFLEEYANARANANTGLVVDAVYEVQGVPPHVLQNTYRNSNTVKFKRLSVNDHTMAVVEPVNNPSCALLVPVYNLRGAKQ